MEIWNMKIVIETLLFHERDYCPVISQLPKTRDKQNHFSDAVAFMYQKFASNDVFRSLFLQMPLTYPYPFVAPTIKPLTPHARQCVH